MLAKVAGHAVYLVMYVITLAIYPIMIRTKGAGFNIGFSAIGTIVAIFLVENLNMGSLILYFNTRYFIIRRNFTDIINDFQI